MSTKSPLICEMSQTKEFTNLNNENNEMNNFDEILCDNNKMFNIMKEAILLGQKVAQQLMSENGLEMIQNAKKEIKIIKF